MGFYLLSSILGICIFLSYIDPETSPLVPSLMLLTLFLPIIFAFFVQNKVVVRTNKYLFFTLYCIQYPLIASSENLENVLFMYIWFIYAVFAPIYYFSARHHFIGTQENKG